jgi:large conductance mechanosensitive channel
MKGFREFLMRGNVVDLAVGVVIGGAFGAVVKGLVDGFITPLIALIVGKPDFSDIKPVLSGTTFPIGGLITAAVMFVLTAAAIYFLVVLPMNAVMARVKRGEIPPAPSTKKCPECLSEIPLAAKKCAFCTSVVA